MEEKNSICNFTRQEVHKWGRKNHVIFDSSKEEFFIIHSIEDEGDDFKIFRFYFDTKLCMNPAIDKRISKIKPKIQSDDQNNRNLYNC